MSQIEATSARKTWFRQYLSDAFGCDLRSLALFRIVMGIILLVDLATRAPYIHVFYTDDGFFNRELTKDAFPEGFWSLHLLSGSETFQNVMFLIAAAFAVLLLIGYKTRFVTFVSWLMLISLHVRCPVILNAGDTLLRVLLFWAIFLPLGKVASFDAWMRREDGPESPKRSKVVLSGASAGIILQLCFMYWFTGIAKFNEQWLKGESLEYVLRMDLFIKPFGKWLLDYPELLKFLTISTVWCELFLPCLMFLPFVTKYTRGLNILAFFGLHLGIVSAISVGLFSVISMMGWLPLIPSAFWDRLGAIFSRRTEGSQEATDTPVPDTNGMPANSGLSPARKRWVIAGNVACLAMLFYLLLWNIHNIETLYDSKNPVVRNGYRAIDRVMYQPWLGDKQEYNPSLAWFGRVTMLGQEFEMFGPVPEYNHWFVYRARLENGTTVDLLHGGPATDVRPDPIMHSLPDHRWRKLHRNITWPAYKVLREPLAEYFCKVWNREHGPDEQIVKMDLVAFHERIYPGAEPDHFVELNLASVKFRDEEEAGAFLDLLDAMESGQPFLP